MYISAIPIIQGFVFGLTNASICHYCCLVYPWIALKMCMIKFTVEWNHRVCMVYVFNLLKPSDSYMRHLPRPSLVQIMACRLIGAKPLSETMLYAIGPLVTKFSQIVFKTQTFSFKWMHLKMLVEKCPPFCLNVLRLSTKIVIESNWSLAKVSLIVSVTCGTIRVIQRKRQILVLSLCIQIWAKWLNSF